jgi:hypothetical protein
LKLKYVGVKDFLGVDRSLPLPVFGGPRRARAPKSHTLAAAAATKSVLLGHMKAMVGATRANPTVPIKRSVCHVVDPTRDLGKGHDVDAAVKLAIARAGEAG